MPRFNNVRSPQGPNWFDWLPAKMQGLLALLCTLGITVILFLSGMHCVHTGKPLELGPKGDVDAVELFCGSACALVISGSIFAVMMGWANRLTPHVSETHHRRPPK